MPQQDSTDFREGKNSIEEQIKEWIFTTDLNWALSEALVVIGLIEDFERDFPNVVKEDSEFMAGLKTGCKEFLERHERECI